MSRTFVGLSLVVVALASATACGGGAIAPRSGAATTTTTTPAGATAAKLAQAQRTHEYPGLPGARQTVPAAYEDPAKAVQAFALVYINWTSTTAPSRLNALAKLSIGAARSMVALEAVQAARDYELKRSGVANQGTVEAVSPLAKHAHEYVVVTKEQTTASNSTEYQGLQPAWHVSLATVTRVTLGWAVSSWQPQN